MSIRVLIADDQPRARHSLEALLSAMRLSAVDHTEQAGRADPVFIEVVGEAENGARVVEQILALHPDVVVMDLQTHTLSALVSDMDGISTIKTIKQRVAMIRIVMLTMYATDRGSILAAEQMPSSSRAVPQALLGRGDARDRGLPP
ncbi:MAG: response regulator [Anaerolineales bacterium]|nr:response regulator [Anaerolineales bacterium]